MGRPVFVVEIRPDTNEVVIGENDDVFSDFLVCGGLNWMAVDGLGGHEMEATATEEQDALSGRRERT